MARVLILATLSALLATVPVGPLGAEQGPAPTPDQTGGESPPPTPPSPPPAPPAAASTRDAEQIAKLSSSIAEDTRRLDALKAELDGVKAEVDRANADFTEVEQTRRALAEELERLREEQQPSADRQSELDGLDKTLALAAERRELAATDLKNVTEQIVTLETKLRQSDQALKKLLGSGEAPPVAVEPPAAPPAPAPTTPAAPEPAGTAAPPAPAPAPAVVAAPSAPAPEAPAPEAEPAEESGPSPMGIPGLGSIPKPAAGTPASAGFGPDPDDPKLKKAREDAQGLAAVLERSERDVVELTERLRTIDEQLRNEEQARDTAQRIIDNAEASGAELARGFQEKLFGRAPPEELREIQAKIRDNEKRLIQARLESREHGDEIIRLQAERGELAGQLQLARWQAESARSQLNEAQSALERMENPFSPENILGWLLNHGVKVVVIILGMVLLRWGSGLLSRRIVTLLSSRSQRGTTAEKEHRISTLVGVFDNAASVAIVIGGFLMVFQEVGVPVGPLLGGAAVFGLAVAFGAQNLIRDYFYGFVILLENQYKLNDVIKIRDIAGQVEAITLRVTVLRDLEGCVHFVPNGEITQVTNMTHGWSRALFDIGVAYKENVDRVMEVIMEVGKELRKDPMFRMLILEDPTMLGVDSFADSAVQIKFFIKTRPLQQWAVKRELLRRLKNRFDELGIEIPFPHRTVYHRGDEGRASQLLTEPHVSDDEVIVAGRAGPGASMGR
ncbi:mechanosensitive ion channel family protein [Tautonia plasticadhaerens]|uniref:Putative MscS family protein YkuT n=1 Tax=Tautonia plasticadhaerens TaxID=2527974 RepID=A0A518GX82_9BACT|nr:mechanosensitive ion channel family protein [Tautonia plasticadhaerens]QDV33206.1 putative MscS family protein YkuT [Tautonia plasticadhaerens]